MPITAQQYYDKSKNSKTNHAIDYEETALVLAKLEGNQTLVNEIYAQQKMAIEATKKYSVTHSVLKRNASVHDFYFLRDAIVCFNLGLFQEACDHFEKYFDINRIIGLFAGFPDAVYIQYAKARIMLGENYQAQDKPNNTIDFLKILTTIANKNKANAYLQGYWYLMQNKISKAFACFKEALNFLPPLPINPPVFNEKASENSIQEITAYLQLVSAHIETLSGVGFMLGLIDDSFSIGYLYSAAKLPCLHAAVLAKAVIIPFKQAMLYAAETIPQKENCLAEIQKLDPIIKVVVLKQIVDKQTLLGKRFLISRNLFGRPMPEKGALRLAHEMLENLVGPDVFFDILCKQDLTDYSAEYIWKKNQQCSIEGQMLFREKCLHTDEKLSRWAIKNGFYTDSETETADAMELQSTHLPKVNF